MPGGTGRGLALGIAQGARNFLDSFLAVKQAKHEEKWRKLAPIIQAVDYQIQDPNTPLDQKIKALDSLPHILGSPSTIPLSQTLGLDKLAEQQVDTGQTQTIKQGQTSGGATDQGAVDYNNININQQGAVQPPADPNAIATNPSPLATSTDVKAPLDTTRKLLRRRGEMSSNDIALQKQLQVHAAEQQDEFTRQYKLEQLHASLQERVLNNQGWKNNGDWNYDDSTKTWQQDWFNPITKESYQQRLKPGIVPEQVILKQIQASGGNKSGVSKAYSTLRTAIATQMGKEEDDPSVQLATANLWKNNFQAGVDYKEQGVTGTRKIQPAQSADDARAAEQNRIALQGDYDSKRSKAVESSNRAYNSAAEANTYYNNNIKPMEADEQADNLDDDQKKELAAHRAEYQRLKNIADSSKAEDEGNKTALQDAHNKLLSSSQSRSLQTPGSSQFSPRMRVSIDAVRKANPNTKLSDDQIAVQIRTKKGNDW